MKSTLYSQAIPVSTARGAARLIVLIGSLAAVAIAAAQEIKQSPEARQYIVGPDDVLAITVFGRDELSGKYMVQADGSFTFPLLNRVKVGGLGVQQIENDLRQRLADGFLKNPQVGVTVEQYRSQQVIIIGEVRNPQTLEFTGSMTLMTALARAGSITERAAPEAFIQRASAGAALVRDRADIERLQKAGDAGIIQVDLEALTKGALSENVVLRGGDTVFVPKAATAFVSGHVVTPGEYPIRKGMTVRQILALAGGPTERGSTSRMQVIRQVGKEDKTLDIELQDQVQPNDTIVVRERFF
jgi:polysaccharide export outer membrane protein